jgi:hypothetical protein
MENVTFIDVQAMGVTDTHAIIDHGNEQYTSMLKSVYDAMQAAETNYLTPSAILESTQPDEADLTEGNN